MVEAEVHSLNSIPLLEEASFVAGSLHLAPFRFQLEPQIPTAFLVSSTTGSGLGLQ